MKEDALALAEDVESTIGGCYGCLLDKRGLCKAESDFDCNDEVCKFVAHRLREIVEHDAGEVTTVSAYDLLPDEDREAIAWVREQGGLDLVKAFVHQGAVEHGFLLKIVHTLGTSIYDGTDNADALLDKLRKRLMPEGMEWPRFEDDEPVRFGDEFVDRNGDTGVVYTVKFGKHVFMVRSIEGHVTACEHGERVKRPAPKVVDADGVEIRAGDEVYIASCGDGPWTVTKITTAHAWHVYGHSDELGSLDMQPNLLTHRAPVLAADGRPLREGEKVWGVDSGTRYTVEKITDELIPIKCRSEMGTTVSLHPSQLTHERPDSWERLERDAEKTVCEYFGANYDCANCPLESARCAEEVKKDIIRRAKKLAERDA